MQEENTDFLKERIHSNAVFIHMGVTLKRDDEINVMLNKGIVYKEIDIEEVNEILINTTHIVLTKLKLTAIVDGNEVINPFVVTEVYTGHKNQLQLASLSYTRINY